MELKQFQRDTVAEVIKRLQHGAYAIADETGLGKTVVCGDVARSLIERHRGNESFIIYYIAPSIELLDQNLESIANHLTSELRPAGKYKVHTAISRITQIPLFLARQESDKKNVFVVGLSPLTSFKISGTGRMEERAFLAALFGINCKDDTKLRIANCFWCMDRRVDPKFINQAANYNNRDLLGTLYEWRNTCQADYRELMDRILSLEGRSHQTLKERRKLVTEVRRKIALFLIESSRTLPHLVVFDEWHKYKESCFEPKKKSAPHERFVPDMLARLRKTKRSKVLFVSATPFTVDYGELHGSAATPASSDLRSLIQLFWEKDRFEAEYQRLRDKQAAFVAAVEQLLKHSGDHDLEELRAKARLDALEYEDELRRYCVRTERPKAELHNPKQEDAPQWDEMFESGSAKEFVHRFSRLRNVRSPVTAMWMDGHTFPEAQYEGLKAYTISNIKKKHWKIQHLESLLKTSMNFQDGLHSLERPPLWLRPEENLQGRKHLIFSEFRFVPEEICTFLRSYSKVTDTDRFSGSVLGFFPLAVKRTDKDDRSDRKTAEKNLSRSIHFPLFYPFLFWELAPAELAQRVGQNRQRLDAIVDAGEYAVPTILEIEKLLVQDLIAFQKPLEARQALMQRNSAIPTTARFREYLKAIFSGKANAWAPGGIAAGVIGHQRHRPGKAPMRPKDFEQTALELGAALFHLFVSPEAQVLKKYQKALPKAAKLPKEWEGWNSYLRFALWYAKHYQLKKTLEEFSEILSSPAHNGLAVLRELVAAMTLKRGSVGTKFFRSFHDRKVDDVAGPGDATVSTQSLRSAFNSPFPPYVLASTSVGQEGLDFHRYCDSIIHWTPPSSPATLRQREGRLDRYRSLQVRIAREAAERGGILLEANAYSGLSPDFVVMHEGERLNRARSSVFYLPFTAQQATWHRCLQRMHYDDLLIGAPDPLADEQQWLNAIDGFGPEERARRFALLKEFSISLKPPCTEDLAIDSEDCRRVA